MSSRRYDEDVYLPVLEKMKYKPARQVELTRPFRRATRLCYVCLLGVFRFDVDFTRAAVVCTPLGHLVLVLLVFLASFSS